MSAPRTFAALKCQCKTACWLWLACALWLGCSVVPVQAQFTYQDLYDFNCATGGCYPADSGSLTQVVGGFYGTDTGGYNYNSLGTLFYVTTTPSVTYNDFYIFSSTNVSYGGYPQAAVVFDTYGNYYAATGEAGANGYGTLYANILGVSENLHDFTSAEGSPVASPVLGRDGNLYGITYGNLFGPPCCGGAAYTVVTTPTGSTYQSLGTYAPGPVYGPLFLAADGYLYGTSVTGGQYGSGTVFRMSTPDGAIHTVFSFNGKNGAAPYGPLVQDLAGNVYGTTYSGGKNGTGVIFKIAPKGGYTKLFDFGSPSTLAGGGPYAGLTLGADGNLYGVTQVGGEYFSGIIFQISTTGTFRKLFDFNPYPGMAPSGALPVTGLTLNSNGVFYGLTQYGGANSDGVFFSLTPVNLIEILIIEGPIFVPPGLPVEFLGNDLTQSAQITFGGVLAQFQVASDSNLYAAVPMDAVDGVVVDTFQNGLQIQTLQAMHILPLITNLDPASGAVGTQVDIVGGGFAGATKVTFDCVDATNVSVVNPTLIQAIVPTGAKTGKVRVTTPNGAAESAEKFTVN